jgi:hypothetical protein
MSMTLDIGLRMLMQDQYRYHPTDDGSRMKACGRSALAGELAALVAA